MPPSFNQNKCVDFGFQSCISNFLLKQKIYGGNIFNFNNRAVFIHKKKQIIPKDQPGPIFPFQIYSKNR